jgi:kynureninase
MSSTSIPEEQLYEYSKKWGVDIYSKEFAIKLDESKLWPTYRDKFFYPKLKDLPPTDLGLVEDPNEECVYLCGNSLGLQSKLSREYVERELEKWAKM